MKTRFIKLMAVGVLGCLCATGHADETLYHDAQAIENAREGMKKEVPVTTNDAHRPVYHFLPEARWMNDPNGAFYQDGWYHVFYQFNPYGNSWGNMHWGHARSRDNVNWERLPVGVWPSKERGEDHCYSGSAVQDGYGKWQIWYTSVSRPQAKDKDKGKLAWVFNGQVMVKPMNDDYTKWGKTTDDPVNNPTLPNNIDGYAWNNYIRDPAFFKVDGRQFMLLGITGTKESGGNVAPIYEAANKELTEWNYLGEMTDHAWDCPQMIPLGEKFMYVWSSGASPNCSIGTFDPKTAKFSRDNQSKLDYGKNYHTISYLKDDRGRIITYSWIIGTNGAKGWNNCFAIPRVVTLGSDGYPVQKPIPELQELRSERVSEKGFTGAKVLSAKGDTIEINAIFEQADKGRCGLRVRRSDDGKRALEIVYENGELNAFGHKVRIEPHGETKTLKLQVFLDKSIMEVFVNDGAKTITSVKYPPLEDLGIEVFADGKGSVDVYQMKSIWSR